MLTKNDLDQIAKTVVVPLRKDMNRLERNMKKIVDYLDRDAIVIKKRVDIIERHLGLSATQIYRT